ncbi:hypothetical protein FACS189494_05880 [Spirochaetia bacterium]|nr:hypothetical protein FACS189494_05880 [Spirochaetia bacterium]
MLEFITVIWNYIYNYASENQLVTVIQLITMIPYGIAFWRKKKKNVLLWVAISCLLFGFGYLLSSAYSGIIIAAGTFVTTIIGISFGKKANVTLKVRFVAFFLMVGITIVLSLLIEQNSIMWLVLIAGFFDYFAYIVFREYDRGMHFVLILSQITLVIYEVFFFLYLFAILDFVTMIIIFAHLREISHEVKIINKQTVC